MSRASCLTTRRCGRQSRAGILQMSRFGQTQTQTHRHRHTDTDTQTQTHRHTRTQTPGRLLDVHAMDCTDTHARARAPYPCHADAAVHPPLAGVVLCHAAAAGLSAAAAAAVAPAPGGRCGRPCHAPHDGGGVPSDAVIGAAEARPEPVLEGALAFAAWWVVVLGKKQSECVCVYVCVRVCECL